MNTQRSKCNYCERVITVGAPMDSHVHSKHWQQVRERVRFAILLYAPEIYFKHMPKQLPAPRPQLPTAFFRTRFEKRSLVG